jgi:rhamnose transport system ATP-binding protein
MIASASNSALLIASNICKSYAGVQALTGASFELRRGEVHALIGENGAGKSTLVKVITGAVQPDSGEILFDGELVTDNSPAIAKARGVAAIYQQPALFPDLTVTENVALGLERAGSWRRIDWARRRRQAVELLARVRARINPDSVAGDLSMPQQQLVEIARALGARSKVLIMDEPTASLSEDDAQNLFAVVRELREAGTAIIYISHRLEELPRIADRVTVLRDGRTIATGSASELNRDQLIQLMVGRKLATVFSKKAPELGETTLELRNLGCVETGIHAVSLSVRAGEIVGLAGLVGAGRSELARTVFGLTPADDGEILVRGQAVQIGGPHRAVECGIAYVPEDRQRHGVIPELPICANITLASLDRLSSPIGLNFRKETQVAADYTARLNIKTPSIFASVATLSGGNQQKVALSRWLMTKPSVLILDEPTQGIDVAARSEIHRLMIDLAGSGVAILMISSDLLEILGMSDRIAVMHGGTIAGIFDRNEATQEKILALALGRDTASRK